MRRTPPSNSREDDFPGYVQRVAQYWAKEIENEGNYVPYPLGLNHESSHGQKGGSKRGYQHGGIPQVKVPTHPKGCKNEDDDQPSLEHRPALGRKSEGDQPSLELHGSGYGFEDRRRTESAEPGYGRKPSSYGEEVEGSRGGSEVPSNMTRGGVGSEKPSNIKTLEGAGSEKPSDGKPSNIMTLEGVGSEKPSDYGGGEEGEPHNGAEGNDHNEQGMSVKPKKPNFDFPPSTSKGRFQVINSNELKEIGKLGSGAFGTVYHGKWGHIDVAIKRINERFAGELAKKKHMRYDFLMEAIKLAELRHPNVVTFYGVVFDNPGDPVAIVTEYMDGGSLRIALQKNKRDLDKTKRLFIAMDVAFGMKYLHSSNIIHFDLKSDNLLVNLDNLKRRNRSKSQHTPICKVADLGLSKVKRQTLISSGIRGTLPWMAPELLKNHNNHVSEKIDVFSFGIVMWELLTGKEPYSDLHDGEIIGRIMNNTLRPLVPDNCDSNWRSLMERCWSNEPSERPSFVEIVHDLEAMATN